jgi:methylenetetrahydrofolate reductase (NADPH)
MLDSLLNPEQHKSRPVICLEVNPPRGADLAAVFERLDGNIDGIDFLNITDSALAKMRMNPLVLANFLKQRYGKEPLVNISCRDRNVIALQSDLLAGWALNVRSIIALTGDAVSIGDMPDCKGVFEINSIGLLNLLKTLSSGKDLAGNDLVGKPDYLPGVVVNPNAKNMTAELKRLQRKKDAGAVYALSQPVFDIEVATTFFKEASVIGIGLLIGLLPFKSAQSLQGISRIPGIKIPAQLIEKTAALPTDTQADFSLEHCLEVAASCSNYVTGFHVISGATPKLGIQLTRKLILNR